MATVDSLANVLTSHNAEQRNSEAWPRWGEYVWPNYYVADNFQDEVSYLKQWLSNRIAWMDNKLGFDPTAYLRGDVDGDGYVGMDDLTALINYLVTGNTTGIDLIGADVDDDGRVGMDDLTALINYLVYNTW